MQTGSSSSAANDKASERQAGLPQGLTLVVQSILPTMGALLLVPVAPLIAQEYRGLVNLDYWIPALLTVPALCIALFSIPSGFLGDRLGRRNILIAALALYGAVGIAPLFLTSFAAVFASRVALGVCEAAIITLSATLIGDYFQGAQRDRWLALISTVASLSAAIFLAVSGVIGAHFGWRGPTAIYALSLLIVPAMLLFTWEPSRHHAEASATVPFPWKHMLLTSAVTLFGSVMFYTVVVQQGLALEALGTVDPARIGMLSAIASLANPLGTLLFWRVSHLRPGILLTAEFLALGICYILMGSAETDVQFAAAAAAALLACGFLLPTMISWTMRGLPFSIRARGVGIFQCVFALGQFGSGLIVTFLSHQLSGILPGFAALGACSLTGAVLGIVLVAKGRASADADPV